ITDFRNVPRIFSSFRPFPKPSYRSLEFVLIRDYCSWRFDFDCPKVLHQITYCHVLAMATSKLTHALWYCDHDAAVLLIVEIAPP
ncbi:MAG TPA: hypothetical protein VIE87_02470, partial [Pseudolabrys sp.]